MATTLYSQHMTLGTLDVVSEKLCMPSTLTYKERIHLRDNDDVEYKRFETASLLPLYSMYVALYVALEPIHDWGASETCNRPRLFDNIS